MGVGMGPLVRLEYYLSKKYVDYVVRRDLKALFWNAIQPYRRPQSFTPLVSIYIAAFYTAVVGAAITEQLYKEKYWENHPGEAVPLMHPKFYWGAWKVYRGTVPLPAPDESIDEQSNTTP